MNARLHPEGLCGHLDGGPFGRGISLIFFLRSFTFSHFYVQLSLLVISLGSRRGVVGEGVGLDPTSPVASPERSAVRLYILPVVRVRVAYV